MPGKHRSRYSQSAIGWNTGPPMEELGKYPRSYNPIGGTTIGTNQYLPELVSLAAYVAEDGLVGHLWEERPLGLTNFICPNTGECQGQEAGVGGYSGWEEQGRGRV